MKTEELKALGLNDEQVQKVFAMHGEDCLLYTSRCV